MSLLYPPFCSKLHPCVTVREEEDPKAQRVKILYLVRRHTPTVSEAHEHRAHLHINLQRIRKGRRSDTITENPRTIDTLQ